MKSIITRYASAMFLFLGLFLLTGTANKAAAQSACTLPPAPIGGVPQMTVKIYNNSPDSIYPVFETGPGPIDQWMQAYFQLSATQVDNTSCYTFPRKYAYRLYVNPTGAGIPPKSSVTVTLPLFSQLTETIDPTADDQFIDWWQGGRIYIFTSPYVPGGTCAPPNLTADLLVDQQNPVDPKLNPPSCDGCAQPPQIYKSYQCSDGKCGSPSLPVSDPSQIVEYSLGAIPATNLLPPNPKYYLQTNNVDFDISYVNFVFLPGLVETYIANPDPVNIKGASNYPGYFGTPKSITTVQQDIGRWLGRSNTSPYKGWPEFVPPSTNETCVIPSQYQQPVKLPAPLQVFASMECVVCNSAASYDKFVPSLLYTATPCDPTKVTIGSNDYDLLAPACLWKPIKDLVDLWQGCTKDTSDQSVTCNDIRTVNALFLKNYESYTANYPIVVPGQTSCDQSTSPIPLNLSTLLGHVYGWTPFNDGCPAQWNTLEGGHEKFPQFPANPDYPTQKMTFDRLNKGEELPVNDKHALFNPYVLLVHDQSYIGATNVYSYSVDDALGNFQGEGTGMIVAFGGTSGLPNAKAATNPVYLGYGGNELDAIHFTNFSVCDDSLNHLIDYRFPGPIDIWNTDTNDITKCPIALGDNLFQKYFVRMLQGPPYPPTRPNEQDVPIAACGIPTVGTVPGCYNYIDPKTRQPVQFIDCSANTPGSAGATWCNGITVHTDIDYNLKQSNYVTAGAPTQPSGGVDYTRDFLVILGNPNGPQQSPDWKDYAVCQSTAFTPLGGSLQFVVDTVANNISSTNPCMVTVRDALNRTYQFRALKAVPWEKNEAKATLFDCTNVSNQAWCNTINPFIHIDPVPLFNVFQLDTQQPPPLKKQ